MGRQVGETGLFGETGPLIAEHRQPHHPLTLPPPPTPEHHTAPELLEVVAVTEAVT
jgi:hypothetical protein